MSSLCGDLFVFTVFKLDDGKIRFISRKAFDSKVKSQFTDLRKIRMPGTIVTNPTSISVLRSLEVFEVVLKVKGNVWCKSSTSSTVDELVA